MDTQYFYGTYVNLSLFIDYSGFLRDLTNKDKKFYSLVHRSWNKSFAVGDLDSVKIGFWLVCATKTSYLPGRNTYKSSCRWILMQIFDLILLIGEGYSVRYNRCGISRRREDRPGKNRSLFKTHINHESMTISLEEQLARFKTRLYWVLSEIDLHNLMVLRERWIVLSDHGKRVRLFLPTKLSVVWTEYFVPRVTRHYRNPFASQSGVWW
jgi:hypothetical protein